MKRTCLDDLGYFDEYPAPMFEAMTACSPSSRMNHTSPLYGPLLYWLYRCSEGGHVIELGVSFGWTGGFLANAVKDHNTRHGTNFRYIGVDIINLDSVASEFAAQDLPATFVTSDSIQWLETQKEIDPGSVGLAFVDDLHNTEHIVREVELLYPLLRDAGYGYMAHHDVYDLSEQGDKAVRSDPRYEWETMRWFPNYGLSLFRKMENYPWDKVWRPEGDQAPYPPR